MGWAVIWPCGRYPNSRKVFLTQPVWAPPEKGIMSMKTVRPRCPAGWSFVHPDPTDSTVLSGRLHCARTVSWDSAQATQLSLSEEWQMASENPPSRGQRRGKRKFCLNCESRRYLLLGSGLNWDVAVGVIFGWQCELASIFNSKKDVHVLTTSK